MLHYIASSLFAAAILQPSVELSSIMESNGSGAPRDSRTNSGTSNNLLGVLHEVYSSLASTPQAPPSSSSKRDRNSESPPSPGTRAAAAALASAGSASMGHGTLERSSSFGENGYGSRSSSSSPGPAKRHRGDSTLDWLRADEGGLEEAVGGGGDHSEELNALADEEEAFALSTFPPELDFDFAVAVFELGLRHSSPRVRDNKKMRHSCGSFSANDSGVQLLV